MWKTWFRRARQVALEQQRGQSLNEKGAEDMATITLLLVDDEGDFLRFLKTRLENRGMKTLAAANGLDAIKLMDEHHIDVVVLDVKMSGIDGLQVLRKIKQGHPLVEVILLSGHATVDSAIEGLKLGAFDYLTKPCDISELMTKVDEAYSRKQTTEEKTRKAKVDKTIRHPMAVFEDDDDS
jgi:DNA-binding NtrC family response regulator